MRSAINGVFRLVEGVATSNHYSRTACSGDIRSSRPQKTLQVYISGSRAALEITVVPSAQQAASITFSVAPTLAMDNTISRP